MTLPVEVALIRNPWAQTVPDERLMDLLVHAAQQGAAKLEKWIAKGKAAPDRNSFGAVILDPTRPRGDATLQDRILAVITIGDLGDQYVPNGAAKADAHDRHGVPNGILVQSRNHCLGDDDFAWAGSVEYQGAIGAGSGLSAKQDAKLMLRMLRIAIDGVREIREIWLEERRADGGRRAWWNEEDSVHIVYLDIVQQLGILSRSA